MQFEVSYPDRVGLVVKESDKYEDCYVVWWIMSQKEPNFSWLVARGQLQRIINQ